MEIARERNGTSLLIRVKGRIDTTNASQLEDAISDIEDVRGLVFDFSALEYISSAGLRVLLAAYRIMDEQGKMTVRGSNETVMEIFEVTGFSDILDLE